jgi:hypothetical protein
MNPHDELTRRKIDVWHFLEEVYGHDQHRHPFGEAEYAVRFYAEMDDKFYKKVNEYYQEWVA